MLPQDVLCNKLSFFLLLFLFVGYSCKKISWEPDAIEKQLQHQQTVWNHDLTWVIIEDIFTPPVASRIYAYANLAAYEAIQHGYPDYQSLSGQLNGFVTPPQPDTALSYAFPVSAMIAFATTASQLVFASEKVNAYEQQYLAQIQEYNIPDKILERSIAYGRELAEYILDWAQKDGYNERQALPAHEYSQSPGDWTPTPPTYMTAIEPHWNTLRPFVLDSATQFIPQPPTEFSTTPGSQFYEETMEVYQAVKAGTKEHVEIAKFWDCNPNIAYFKGHVMLFHQKISPGGHWISIAGIAAKQEELSLIKEAEVFALTSIALADAFIACWDEKYRSNLIRPETYIERYIDSTWFPILETPAFPEHTSGHSVISTAAATVLTQLVGDNIAFEDTTEVKFGLPSRHFDSFLDASAEAAISRLYGGIHYRPAIAYGVAQGENVGKYVLDNLQTQTKESTHVEASAR